MLKFCLYIGVIFATLTSNAQKNTLPPVKKVAFKNATFSIVKYGAVADGITHNTKSINDAIIACNKNGGGTVLVPKGIWLTGPIVLLSNVNLHLDKNALLQFTNDLNQYKLIETNWEGLKAVRNESPISATNATNIAITGSGIIDGNGDAWRMVKKDKLSDSQWKNLLKRGGVVSDDKKTWYPTPSSFAGSKVDKPGVMAGNKTIQDFVAIKDFLRPNLLVLTKCDQILLEGVTFQNSPAWNLHPLMCTNLTVRNVYAKNPWYAQNGDGIDIESCKNVLLENSTFDVGDDGICIKSGRDEEGRKRAMPTENLLVRNCTVYHAHGGFVIGSEMSGGAKNIYVEDCTFIGTDIGLRFKTTRGRGGIVENIFVNNITMKDIVGDAILFDMYYAAKDPIVLAGEKREAPVVEFKKVDETTPQFKNIYIKNVVSNGAERALFVRGLPEMNIHDIAIENFTSVSLKGIEMSEAYNFTLKNCKFIVSETTPTVDVLNSHDIDFVNILPITTAPQLIRIGGERSSNIHWFKNKVNDIKTKTIFEFGATDKALQIND
ncbi:glycoside hydrolase family 28 protein [Ferruginibacter yonginensis]|uniref:Glycoside hydrolase family 28 protein n=1 Tax=Ferruginibacter yonginensis TaxID=1310416 RepID=A0ABV8QNX7_9BACT